MSDVTPDTREAVLEWLEDWLDNDAGLGEEGIEVLRDIVERPDEHEPELRMLVEHDDTAREIADALQRADPQDWGYPAEDWDDVRRSRDLQAAGLSRMQAIVRVWKEKDLTHEQIADETGIEKGTIDVHSRRAARKVREAKRLVKTVESGS